VVDKMLDNAIFIYADSFFVRMKMITIICFSIVPSSPCLL
jgi:hypothetical protein